MSRLKDLREINNLTQEDLSKQSRISVRTIQRIEAGTKPKGHTLRVLAQALGVKEKDLLNKATDDDIKKSKSEEDYFSENVSKIKLINLSSLPFIILPPLNILLPIALMFAMKLKNPLTKEIVSLQIMWTITAPILFMLGIFLKLGNEFTLLIMILLALSNVYITLRNAVELDKRKRLYYRLNFSMI